MRQAGVLLPVFSLPGRYGIGDFGENAYRMADRLAASGVRIWQVLPLNPVGYGHSPYQPYSSFAGETSYINLEMLKAEGLLLSLPEPFSETAERVDYEAVRAFKEPYFREAFRRFTETDAYREFIAEDWVFPYAVFAALKKKNGFRTWMEWDPEDRDWIRLWRNEDTKKEALERVAVLDADIRFEMFLQYEFFRQWKKLKAYVNALGILVMGDIPFYVGQDSVDVWANQECFLLESDGYPQYIAGVPPDYFSATGQRWGNPIYNWAHFTNTRYRFWIQRILGNETLFDLLRIDHFRAFDTYWKIPASCPTAVTGEWVEAPGYDFFNTLLPALHSVKIIAEDLGEMRPEVYKLRDDFEFPGMNVLEFTLADANFQVRENMIAYTGTHDNNTVRGWWAELSLSERERFGGVLRERGYEPDEENIAAIMVEEALRTDSQWAVIPAGDILELDAKARINTPGVVNEVNWTWKMADFKRFDEMLPAFTERVKASGRF